MARRVLSDDERVLWSAVTKSIAPLRDTAVTTTTEEVPTETAKPARASARVPPPAPQPVRAAPPQPPQPPQLEPLGRRKRSRVARGKEQIDGRLDLHGLTQSEAHATLLRFLHAASARQARLVLVITGKGSGKSSDLGGRGVLRRQLPHWLALPEFRALVVGFEQASVRHAATERGISRCGGAGRSSEVEDLGDGEAEEGEEGQEDESEKAGAEKGRPEKAAALKKTAARKKAKKMRADDKLEEGLLETFPGSDPVAITDPTTIDKRE